MQELRCHVILYDLVLEDAEAGLLDRQARQFGGGTDAGAHHGLDDPIDLDLIELAEFGGRGSGDIHDRVDLIAAALVVLRGIAIASGLRGRIPRSRPQLG